MEGWVDGGPHMKDLHTGMKGEDTGSSHMRDLYTGGSRLGGRGEFSYEGKGEPPGDGWRRRLLGHGVPLQ